MSGLLDGAKKAYLTVKKRATPAQAIQPVAMRTMRMHTKKVSAVAFFKDGRRIVTASEDKTLRIWDMKKKVLVGGPFEGHSGCVYSVAVSLDDRRIASGGENGTIIIWDVDSKQMVFKLPVEHTSWVYSVCFSPDGKRLASGSFDERVVIWDAETGAVLSTFFEGWVCCVAFSPDGLKLAAGKLNGTIRVWSTDNAELLLSIDAHQGSVRSVVWSPDGQQFVSASDDDTTVKFWHSSNGTQIGQPCTGHTDNIDSLAISSDGSFIATASQDKTVRLWNTKSHQQIGQLLKHTARVCCVAISPNGELLTSGDFDGNLQLWSIEDTLSFGMDPSCDFYFVHRSKVKLGQNLYAEALSDADKVIERNPSYYLGYELKHSALRGAQRYDDASEAFTIMLSKLDHASDPQIRQLRQKYISPSEVEDAIQRAIHAQLENAPLCLINTSTGRLCNRDAQIKAFMASSEHRALLRSFDMHEPLQTEPIKKTVFKYFSWVMLSHRWGKKEPGMHDIQGKDIYGLNPVGTIVKLQKFCEVARHAGYRWAWSDTCCIDQSNSAELQQSVNSMFIWYRYSALTIVYLSDVPPSSRSGALAKSVWNTRGWTVQEFLAPKIILFYQADWSLYLDDRSRNHKESVRIMTELEHSTGINKQALADFRPGTRYVREKLRWVSNRGTTREEDIAYSLFGIFRVHLPVIYGEKRQNALGRLLEYIITHSGDITALDWVGQSSNFNSCLPAEISSYKALPYTLPSLYEQDMQISISKLRNNIVAVKSASKLYTLLDNLSGPHFANARLQLPCITFPLTEVRRRVGTPYTYHIKADGLKDLEITTADKLVQFWPSKSTSQKFFLILPWNRQDLGLPDFADEMQGADDRPEPGSPSDDPLHLSPSDNEQAGSQSLMRESSLLDRLGQRFGARRLEQKRSRTRELELVVRLGQPFSALLLAQQRGGEYKRIASGCNIIARVRDMTRVDDMMNVRTLEIL